MILGAGVMQEPALRAAGEMGLKTLAVDANPNAPWASLAGRFECVDLKDKDGLLALASSLEGKEKISGVMTAGTDFSASVAWVAEHLGLPGIPYETALDASDKSRMRGRFALAGLPSPPFAVFEKLPGVPALPFPYPAVVKPVDNMGGRGCRRVDGPSALEAALKDALAFSGKGRAIVEAFMDGPEYSVDALVSGGEVIICGLADRHIFFPPYFIEMGHTMSAVLDEKSSAALLDVFVRGVKALGIHTGAAKGDIKLTPQGPMIGEIAARLSGGYMSGWTYPYASGVDPVRGAIEIALGRRPSRTSPLRQWTSAERAFISIPGRVKAIRGIREAEQKGYVKNIFIRVQRGSPIGFPENNVGKAGNVISQAPVREQAVVAAEEAARSIGIELEVPNAETEAFLGSFFEEGRPSFPPDAFALSPSLRSALLALPCPGQRSGTGQATASTTAAGSPAAAAVAEVPPATAAGSPAGPCICPFPEFTGSDLVDYTGRSVGASLDMVREILGLKLPIKEGGVLGRRFWAGLVRGGYQGAAYIAALTLGERGEGRPGGT
jgi:biotin carboxylase